MLPDWMKLSNYDKTKKRLTIGSYSNGYYLVKDQGGGGACKELGGYIGCKLSKWMRWGQGEWYTPSTHSPNVKSLLLVDLKLYASQRHLTEGWEIWEIYKGLFGIIWDYIAL